MENYVNIVPIGHIGEYSDMSSYPMYPTPPSGTSEGSKSPIYTMLGTTLAMDTNGTPTGTGALVETLETLHFSNPTTNYEGAYLEVLEQPVDKFRFRYKSEMSGTHGSLSGATTEKNRKPTFPTVKLWNYNGPAIMRCSLYSYSKEAPECCRHPHPHRLVRKHDSEEMVDPHDKQVDPKADMTVVFRSMGIIHTAKKHIQDELRIKKKKLKMEEIRRVELADRELKKSEEVELQRQIQDEEKSINLNVVCLRFDAFKDCNGIMEPLCEPIYSNPIFNLKSAMTGDLKIVRMDHCTSPASGEKEIFLLVEKVAKKNIKVQFFELDDSEERIIWSADAKFHENDVHHQYAIVIKTPPYKHIGIEEPTKDVFVQLYRPSDGETSEPRPFTYNPDRGSKRKRGRYDDYTSSSSMELSRELPKMILDMENPGLCSEELKRYADNVDSEEFHNFLPELQNLFGQAVESSMAFDAIGQRPSQLLEKDLNAIKKQYYQIVAYLNTGKPDVEKMVRSKFEDKNYDGNNVFHLCYIHHKNEFSTKLKTVILGVIERLKIYDLLNVENNDSETVLHLSIKNGAECNHLKTLPLEHMTTPKGASALYPLHMAVKYDYGIDELCTRLQNKKIIDQLNGEGFNALQYAVQLHKFDAIKKLVKYGAKVNAQDNCTGNNVLQQSILDGRDDIIEYLVLNTSINKLHKNYEDKDCVTLAKEHLTGAKLRKVFKLLCPGSNPADLPATPAEVKEESESEPEEDMDVDIKTEEYIEIENHVVEATSIELESVPSNFIKEIAALHFDQAIVNELYSDLNFGYMLDIHGIEDRNQMEFLLHLALTNGVRVTEIRKAMQKRGLTEAVKCINRMITKC